ncbi:carbon-nitrogen family hydrolase [Streptomyces sp. A7024]|uniref:Carbon-nitrogen family hydrolase n=1 Tax=Streptomyces coryli TaxID=1128680 RepID=A0A6G4UBC1_9ACTN|nr:carbon-nitrogen family hydrolase [Streptomyces coryli]
MRASLIQIGVDPDETPESRRARAGALVRAHAGADLIVLPELWPMGAFAYDLFAPEAEALDGPTATAMAAAARDADVWLHAGSIVERTADGDLYNTSLVFAPDGQLAATYRKIHRFGFAKGEKELMEAGEQPVTLAALGTTLGLATCYDLRFPELFRLLVDGGAQVLLLPAGWPEKRRAHWTVLAQARAIESQAYVLACGTAGTHAGVPQAGHSMIIAPDGEILAAAEDAEEQVITADLDLAAVAKYRESFPALKDRQL